MPRSHYGDPARILSAANDYITPQKNGQHPDPTVFLKSRGIEASRSTFYKRVRELRSGETVVVRHGGRPTVFDGPQERHLAQYAYAFADMQEPFTRDDWRTIVIHFAELSE
jgi:hypothetical protein